jgi:hypothetical protein
MLTSASEEFFHLVAAPPIKKPSHHGGYLPRTSALIISSLFRCGDL